MSGVGHFCTVPVLPPLGGADMTGLRPKSCSAQGFGIRFMAFGLPLFSKSLVWKFPGTSLHCR